MPRPSAAAARLVVPGVAAVQAGHKVRYFTVADDLIRVLTDVSTCRWLPLNESPYVQFIGQEPEGGCQMAITLPLKQKESKSKAAKSWQRPTNKWWAGLPFTSRTSVSECPVFSVVLRVSHDCGRRSGADMNATRPLL